MLAWHFRESRPHHFLAYTEAFAEMPSWVEAPAIRASSCRLMSYAESIYMQAGWSDLGRDTPAERSTNAHLHLLIYQFTCQLTIIYDARPQPLRLSDVDGGRAGIIKTFIILPLWFCCQAACISRWRCDKAMRDVWPGAIMVEALPDYFL